MKIIIVILIVSLFSSACQKEKSPPETKLQWRTFNSFGNSITAGGGASDASKRYVNQISTLSGQDFKNLGVSGIGIKQQVSLYYKNNPSSQVKIPATVLIGTNDLRSSNSVSRYENIASGINTIIASHFTDTIISASNAKVVASALHWSEFNPSLVLPSKSKDYNLGSVVKSSTSGSTLTFTWRGSNLLIYTYGSDVNYEAGSFNVNVDGKDKITWSGKGKGSDWIIGNYDYNTPTAVYISGLTAGTHKVVITVLENKQVIIDSFGRLMEPSQCAPIIIGHIAKSSLFGYAMDSSFSNDLAVESANLKISLLVEHYRMAGFPIRLAQTNKYVNPLTDYSTNDGLHPNDLGHLHIAQAFTEQLIAK